MAQDDRTASSGAAEAPGEAPGVAPGYYDDEEEEQGNPRVATAKRVGAIAGISVAMAIMVSWCGSFCSSPDVPPSVVERLAAVEARPVAGAVPQAVEERLAALEAWPTPVYPTVEILMAAMENVVMPEIEPVQEDAPLLPPHPAVIARLDTLDQSITDIVVAAAEPSAIPPDLEARLVALEFAPPPSIDLTDIDARIRALESPISTPVPDPSGGPAPTLPSYPPLAINTESSQIALVDGENLRHRHGAVYVVDPPEDAKGVVVVAGEIAKPRGGVPRKGIVDIFPKGYEAFQTLSVDLRDGWDFITLSEAVVSVWPTLPHGVPCELVKLLVNARSSDDGWKEVTDGCTGGVKLSESSVVGVAVVVAPAPAANP